MRITAYHRQLLPFLLWLHARDPVRLRRETFRRIRRHNTNAIKLLWLHEGDRNYWGAE